MWCSSAEWIARNGCALRWCHRQVNWGNCGIPWVNCALLYVKDDWKGQFWGLRYCLSKLRSLLSFSVRYDVTSKIAHFDWECIGRCRICSCRQWNCACKFQYFISTQIYNYIAEAQLDQTCVRQQYVSVWKTYTWTVSIPRASLPTERRSRLFCTRDGPGRAEAWWDFPRWPV